MSHVHVPTAGRNRQELAELAELAATAAARLEGHRAEEIIEWAAGEFGDRFCLTSSFADAVLAHLVSRVVPGIDVIFLETGLHFAETRQVRDLVSRTMPVNVRSIRPRLTVAEQEVEYGPRLYATAPDDCCYVRKVEPLERALAEYDAWAAGLRRDESPSRAGTPVVSFEAGRGKVKVAPIAAWTQSEVEEYIARHDIPVNTLIRQGYASVGCWPCTRRTPPGGDLRGGRWPAFDKTECGLHR